MMLLTWLTLLGFEQARFERFEQYEGKVLGGLLIALGLADPDSGDLKWRIMITTITRRSRHGHDHHSHFAYAHHASEQRLRRALVVLFAFTVVEAAGGFWANSIALLAEATHMLADSVSLLLGILAIRFGRRVASADRTYGNRRFQTLAAYTNGLTLLALTVWVLVEAARRLIAPPDVNGGVMLAVAAVGAVANVVAYLLLSGASSLNERSARAHVMSDVLGSAAAIAAACIILAMGWLAGGPAAVDRRVVPDPSFGWQLTRESAHVLLEGTPANFDAQIVEQGAEGVAGRVRHSSSARVVADRRGADRDAARTTVRVRRSTADPRGHPGKSRHAFRRRARHGADRRRSVRSTERRLPRERDDRTLPRTASGTQTRQRPHRVPQSFCRRCVDCGES